jgi:23S rRNA (uracil747-C5)-methyltransferase
VSRSLGIEINSEAVAEANRSAQAAGLRHLNFLCADASVVGSVVRDFSPEILLVNPPRRGLGASIRYLLESSVPHLIYSSCNSESLGRDLQMLAPKYGLERVQIFDMFPHTRHFETLVQLRLK